jgi:CheY-like chemotaxis protein
MKKVLLVEDDPILVDPYADLVEDLGYEAVVASRLSDAIAQASTGDFVAALIDVAMPEGDTREVARILQARGVPFAVWSGRYPADYPTLYGTAPRLPKPFTMSMLEGVLEALIGGKLGEELRPSGV